MGFFFFLFWIDYLLAGCCYLVFVAFFFFFGTGSFPSGIFIVSSLGMKTIISGGTDTARSQLCSTPRAAVWTEQVPCARQGVGTI